MNVVTKELASFFDVSRQAIDRWVAAGCPKIGRGRFDLKAVHKWWIENIHAERSAADDEQLSEAKRRYWSSKADSEKLKVLKERKELIALDDVHRHWAGRVAEYKSGTFNLVDSLPPLLEGKPQPEMRKVVYDVAWNMFDRVCRESEFCRRPDLTDEQIISLWRENHV